MWIEELPNGKYKYIERYEDPLTGKYRKVSMTHTKKNKRVEKEMFLALQEKIEDKTRISSKHLTLGELTDKWLKVHEHNVKSTTFVQIVYKTNKLKRRFGSILVSKLTAAIINDYFLKSLQDGVAYSTLSSERGLFNSIMNHGVTYGYVMENHLKDSLYIPKINLSEKSDLKYLEPYELDNVIQQLEAKDNSEFARLCLIQTLTGMRIGELVSLDYKKHVDLDEKTILIERTYHIHKKEFGSPKNGKTRKININDQTVELLKEQIQFDRLKMLWKNIDKTNTLLFKTVHGNPINANSINSLLKKIRLDSDKVLSTHIFRHTFITLMVEKGVSANLIAEHVGHDNTAMIENVYSHFTETMNEQLKETIARFVI